MVRTTKEQRQALARVYHRTLDPVQFDPPSINRRAWLQGYRAFRRTVHGSFGCIMVPWAGMVLGIEPDGYTHS
jgi:hypothetical protein